MARRSNVARPDINVVNKLHGTQGSLTPCGYIYILTNPSFPEYVKIGYATDVDVRLKQLNRSECIPFAFRVYATYEVYKPLQDKDVHSLIDRINPNLRAIDDFNVKTRVREFYAMSPEDAYSILKSIATISGMPGRLVLVGSTDDSEQSDEATQDSKRRSQFSFLKCGIRVGEEVNFVGHKDIIATVVDERRVDYWGTTYSLSALTKEILNLNTTVQGPKYWEYKGKVLTDLRAEREAAGLYK